MYCSKCGMELPSDAFFCKKCGYRVSAENEKNVSNAPSQQESSQVAAHNDASQKSRESDAAQPVESVQNTVQKKYSKRTVNIILGAVLAIIVLFLISSLSAGNRLVGTWEKTSGEFRLWLGYFVDHSITDSESGELIFKRNDFYVVTYGDGYVYNDNYELVDDSQLVMLVDDDENILLYHISGNTLSLVDPFGGISYWKRK